MVAREVSSDRASKRFVQQKRRSGEDRSDPFAKAPFLPRTCRLGGAPVPPKVNGRMTGNGLFVFQSRHDIYSPTLAS